MLNVEDIQALIKSIDDSSIDEVTYETNETKLTVKKNTGEPVVQPLQKMAAPMEETVKPVVQTPQQETTQVEAAQPAQPQEQGKTNYDYEITSPMVGTMYLSSSPETDVYVQPGSDVKKDTVVCIVEAMKLFNEIEAEVNGEIVEVLVEDGELVEYNQPLFRVKTK